MGVTVAETIRCRGRRKDGRSCLATLAEVVDGRVVVRDHGREHVDPASTTCPRCGALVRFRGSAEAAA